MATFREVFDEEDIEIMVDALMRRSKYYTRQINRNVHENETKESVRISNAEKKKSEIDNVLSKISEESF